MKEEVFVMKKERIEFLVLGKILKGFVWIPASQPKKVLILVHGMAEHIERYDGFATFLAKNNILVYGYDQRGHGDTDPDSLGYIDAADAFVQFRDDLASIVDEIKDKHPKIPLFLLGHSMGSFVTQFYLSTLEPKISGAILSGSNDKIGFVSNIGIFLANMQIYFKGPKHKSKLLDKMSFGAFNKPFVPNRTAFDWLSKDEEIVDRYISSPYDGQIFSAAFFRDFLKGLQTIGKNYPNFPKEIPLYIFSGMCDPVGRMGKGVQKLADRLNQYVTDVTLKLYPDGRHEMLNETNKEEVYQNVLTWLEKH